MTYGSDIRPPSHDHGCRHTASFEGGLGCGAGEKVYWMVTPVGRSTMPVEGSGMVMVVVQDQRRGWLNGAYGDRPHGNKHLTRAAHLRK